MSKKGNPFIEYQKQFLDMWKKGMDVEGNPFAAYQEQFFDMWEKGVEMKDNPFAAYQEQFMEMWKKGMDVEDNPFFAYQKEFLDRWNENIDKIPGMEAYKKAFENMMPDLGEYWKGFINPIPGIEQYWKNVSKMMPDMGAFANGWPYKIPGLDTYTKVFDIWKGLSDPVSFAKDFEQKYMDLMQDLFTNILPEGSAAFMQRPMDFMNMLVGYYKQSFAPFMEIDKKVFERMAQGDLTAYTDFFHEFNEKYEETIGKYYNIMGLGLNRESTEDLLNAMSSYNKAMFATGELLSLVMVTGGESMKKLAKKFQDVAKSGEVPTTFREFYDLWSSVTEAELTKLLNTEKFSKAFNYFADMNGKYMIATNKVLERMLAHLPIPTNTDMKSLYKTVYDLRKEVRDLKREVAALKGKKK